MWDKPPLGTECNLNCWKAFIYHQLKQWCANIPPCYPTPGTTSYTLLLLIILQRKETCLTFIKDRVFRFIITNWRQMSAVRLDSKLLSPAQRDNEQCHTSKSSLSLGERNPALSIRASIIEIVVGPISGDVFPWIVNASCRHFYPCPVALKHTFKDTARQESEVKCTIEMCTMATGVLRNYENMSDTLRYLTTLYYLMAKKRCTVTLQQKSRMFLAKHWNTADVIYCLQSVSVRPHQRLTRLPCTVLTLCWMLISVNSGSFHLWPTTSPGSHLLRRWGWDQQSGWTGRVEILTYDIRGAQWEKKKRKWTMETLLSTFLTIC